MPFYFRKEFNFYILYQFEFSFGTKNLIATAKRREIKKRDFSKLPLYNIEADTTT